MSAAGTIDLRAQRLDVDQQVADLALLGDLEIVLVGLEVARRPPASVAVTCVRNAVGRETDDGELHLVVAAAVFLLEIRRRSPTASR